jgi:stage IV sporulation protein FB
MKIKIHFSLIIFALILIFTGFYQEFMLFFLIILAHECGHYLTAKMFGQKINYLNFTIVGGILDLELKEISRIQKFLIYLSGIGVNGLLIFLSRFIADSYQRTLVRNYNLLLLFFNLIPIYPLDGFQILQTLFSRHSPFSEFRITSVISYLFLVALFVFIVAYRFGLAAWIILSFLIFHNIYLELNKNKYILKKIIAAYRYP